VFSAILELLLDPSAIGYGLSYKLFLISASRGSTEAKRAVAASDNVNVLAVIVQVEP
jgi:hypothetical protein